MKRSTGRAVLFVYLSLLLADDCICLVVVLLHFIDITTHSDVPSDVHYRPAALLESSRVSALDCDVEAPSFVE